MKKNLLFICFLVLLTLFEASIRASSIDTQPSSQTIVQGQPVTLSVVASGSGTLAYQWQKDGADIPGATGAAYYIADFKPWNLGTYLVKVTDSIDTVSSDGAVLTLNTSLPASLWNNLLIFLPMSGNNEDVSSSARGIIQSNVGVTTGPDEGVAGGAAFDGVSSKLDFTPNLPDLTEMTVSFWFKNATNVGHSSLFTDWDDAASNDVGVSLDDQTISVFANKNGGSLSWTSGNVILAGEWNHVSWVMGASVSKVYLNGVLVATINAAADNVGYKLRSNIGYFNYDGGKDFFHGSMSSFRVYGRVLNDAEAIQLYQFDAPAPEIVVEQPEGIGLTNGSATTNWSALPTGGASAPVTYTVRNLGTVSLTGLAVSKVGANGQDYQTGALGSTTVAPSESTSFTVTFAPQPGASGQRTASLQIASNDADESPFVIQLNGTAYSTTLDFDNDGLNDWSEYKLSSLGFDWQVGNTGLVSTLTEAGLYTVNQVQALNVGVPLIHHNPATSRFTLTIGLEKSIDLSTFLPFPMTAPGAATINPEGKLEFQFTAPDNAAFFRLNAQ